MRAEILNWLQKAVGAYNEIMLIHRGKLPKNILDGAQNTIENDIPRHSGNFISVINMVEQKKLFPDIQNIETAIELFSNSELDKSIQKAATDSKIVGVGGYQNMSAREMLEYSANAIRDCLQLLQLQIAAAKLAR